MIPTFIVVDRYGSPSIRTDLSADQIAHLVALEDATVIAVDPEMATARVQFFEVLEDGTRTRLEAP